MATVRLEIFHSRRRSVPSSRCRRSSRRLFELFDYGRKLMRYLRIIAIVLTAHAAAGLFVFGPDAVSVAAASDAADVVGGNDPNPWFCCDSPCGVTEGCPPITPCQIVSTGEGEPERCEEWRPWFNDQCVRQQDIRDGVDTGCRRRHQSQCRTAIFQQAVPPIYCQRLYVGEVSEFGACACTEYERYCGDGTYCRAGQ